MLTGEKFAHYIFIADTTNLNACIAHHVSIINSIFLANITCIAKGCIYYKFATIEKLT